MKIKELNKWFESLGGTHHITDETDIINAIQLNNAILLEILKKLNNIKV